MSDSEKRLNTLELIYDTLTLTFIFVMYHYSEDILFLWYLIWFVAAELLQYFIMRGSKDEKNSVSSADLFALPFNALIAIYMYRFYYIYSCMVKDYLVISAMAIAYAVYSLARNHLRGRLKKERT